MQEEYYDDIYGDLFQKEEKGYFNFWLENNNVALSKKLLQKEKTKEAEIQLKLLREKKIMMQETMDKVYTMRQK